MLRTLLQMIQGWLWVIAITAAIIVAANYAPLFSWHAEQDTCTFGPVSNAQYRGYLIEAQKRQRTKWPAFSRSGQEIGKQLNFRLHDMLGPDATLYERIAIIHAILRAIGAEYLNTNGWSDGDPFESAHNRRHDVTFNYQVDINRLVLFQLWPRQVWIVAALRDPDLPRRDITKQGDRITAGLVSIVDHPADEFLASSGQSCPPTPTAEEAARYQIKQR